MGGLWELCQAAFPSLGTFDLLDLVAHGIGVLLAFTGSRSQPAWGITAPSNQKVFQAVFLGMALFSSLATSPARKVPPGTLPPKTHFWDPIYLSYDDLRRSFAVEAPRPITKKGKILIYKDWIFVSDTNLGIHMIDNKDPVHPKHVHFLNLPGDSKRGVIVGATKRPTGVNPKEKGNGQQLYIGGENALFIYGISNPNHPSRLSELTKEGARSQVVTSGKTAYVIANRIPTPRSTFGENKLYFIDISQPERPTVISDVTFEHQTNGLGVLGNRLFLCNDREGLVEWNVEDPKQFKKIKSIEDEKCFDIVPNGKKLVVVGESGISQYHLGEPESEVLERISQIDLKNL